MHQFLSAPRRTGEVEDAIVTGGSGGMGTEIAAAVEWLTSADASYVNGSLLDVTGGRTMNDASGIRHPVDWNAPSGRPDAVFGTGATRGEKALATITGILGATGTIWLAVMHQAPWNVLQFALAAVIAFDVVGGVVANGLNSAKRDHFGPVGDRPETFGMRVVRRPIIFTALHIHPIVVAVVYSPALWWWGVTWYLYPLAGTVAVHRSPLHLQRPVALAFCAAAAMAVFFMPATDAWAWLPVMLTMKLVLAHAVQEEPYRPDPVVRRTVG